MKRAVLDSAPGVGTGVAGGCRALARVGGWTRRGAMRPVVIFGRREAGELRAARKAALCGFCPAPGADQGARNPSVTCTRGAPSMAWACARQTPARRDVEELPGAGIPAHASRVARRQQAGDRQEGRRDGISHLAQSPELQRRRGPCRAPAALNSGPASVRAARSGERRRGGGGRCEPRAGLSRRSFESRRR
jgi:hypothetical protein